MADSEYKELKAKRASAKGRLTTFVNYVNNLEKIKDVTRKEINELKIRLGKIEALLQSYDDIQTMIEIIESKSTEPTVIMSHERDTTESLFFDVIAAAQDILSTWTQKITMKENSQNDESSSNSDKNRNGVKLPTIKLPEFEGNPQSWLEFKDTFLAIVHNNDSLNNITKFQYLKAALKGQAASVIQSMEISAVNYDVAWQLVCERFDNKKHLIHNHLKELFGLEKLDKGSDKALRGFIDHIAKHLRALTSLGEVTTNWDTIIIFLLASKLDSASNVKWEEFKNSKVEVPKLDDFYKFLRDRANVLEMVSASSSDYKGNSNISSHNEEKPVYKRVDKQQRAFVATAYDTKATPDKCYICKADHLIYFCERFNKMTVEERHAAVSKYRLCINCLREDHFAYQCWSKPCRKCGRKHNTLLHRKASEAKAIMSNPVALSTCIANEVLLSTAVVKVVNNETQETHEVRCLLDCGSQSSFMTESLQQKLMVKCNVNDEVRVNGINNMSFSALKSCSVKVQSCNKAYCVNVNSIVLPSITHNLPTQEIDVSRLNIPENVVLADPRFYHPSHVDLLIGADMFWDIMLPETLKLGKENPRLQNSRLGWLVVGPVMYSEQPVKRNISCNFSQEIQHQLKAFWELEELSEVNTLTPEEEACEEHFKKNTYRLPDGKFCVRMPFLHEPDVLGNSYSMAKRRFDSLERRFERQPDVKDQYVDFIKEYADPDHLSEVECSDNANFLPHHPVLKEESESTKCRVVFDASAKTSSGHSLNDIMMIGPTVQDSMLSILIRFRTNAYILTGDVEKMYRCIRIDESQRHLLTILWREDRHEEIKYLQLNTVTYGTASAPYLSTRCLMQLGLECDDQLVKDAIVHDFYVDDLNTGANDEETVKYLYDRISEKLVTASFNLTKIKSNSPKVLKHVSEGEQGQQSTLKLSSINTILGIEWDPNSDCILMSAKKLQNAPKDDRFTKIILLSLISSIFDPLGLICVCIITCKIILQQLWLLKTDWDDKIPQEINKMWLDFFYNITCINEVVIPRHACCINPVRVELHTFSDASMKAYAGCTYMKSIDKFGNVTVRLMLAKARVAPLKATTIPKLELCGCLLAARVWDQIVRSLRCKPDQRYFWSDSKVALGWLKTPSHKLNVFVANRVVAINELTENSRWRYVPSAENPADLASRGVYPQEVKNLPLWWEGPEFLKNSEEHWPEQSNAISGCLPEIRSHLVNVHNVEPGVVDFAKHSSFAKFRRILAYVWRFINNCKSKKDKALGSLEVAELHDAEAKLAYLSQQKSFVDHKSSQGRLESLAPFVDKKGLIRVGGRLNNSEFDFEKKHPIVIDAKHEFTRLLFNYYHVKFMHAAPQLLLSLIREEYWPINGRALARQTYKSCMRCKRMRAAVAKQLMGSLPAQRLSPGHCFEVIGLDFAGPFQIVNKKGRGSRLIKVYMCIFVCFKVKALHLEIVSDLSTEAFILALRRFISRRGKPLEIFCDNGTNFVGASNELGTFLTENSRVVAEAFVEDGIKFNFSPAYSPNFGGLHEAAVKSAKFHVKRVLGNTHLTFEELATLFTQVEAILNSRPLSPLSSNPNDLSPLTPGHFLIGRPLMSLPAPNLQDVNPNRLHRYARIEQARQHFWSRWSREYVCELQQRNKWQRKQPNLKPGTLVLIKQESTSPMKWPLGRVEAVYPGTDGLTRVADIRTTKGVVKRALNRICPLQDLDGQPGGGDC